MVEGKLKSRSMRRVPVRIPSGISVIHYVPRKPGKAQCDVCGTNLKGMPNVSAAKLKTLSKSQKRPSRPFGGKLCSACSRQAIVSKFRAIFTLSNK